MSLKNRKDKSIRASKNGLEVEEDSLKEAQSPMLSPPVSETWMRNSDSLFYEPQSVTYRNKIHYNKEQRPTSSPFI